jgi:hypothetical protein
MSYQVGPDIVGRSAAAAPGSLAEQTAFVPQTAGTPVAYPPTYHGRAVSWVAVSIIVVGFVCGGLGLVVGPTWVVFWVGVGVAVAGGLLALATNISDDWY